MNYELFDPKSIIMLSCHQKREFDGISKIATPGGFKPSTFRTGI